MDIVIRELQLADAQPIELAFLDQGWNKPAAQYEQYFSEQAAGTRAVLLAEIEGAFAGYLTIVWESGYPPFAEANIPEIVDFNVLEKFQRRSIGSQLMDAAEARIKTRSNTAGIGFGLMHDYGKAQILYAHRGYIPDGRGIYAHGRWLNDGDEVVIGHDIALYLTKKLVT
ncbi:MAG: GNAT family N-acetyltransferase [Chloroflexota bacterium]